MDYDLIVVKTLERVYKNYYYIIRGVVMKNCILNVIASAAERTAKSSVNSASFFTMYQPKEPDALKKDGVDRKKQGNGIF